MLGNMRVDEQKLKPVENGKYLISGPCSAETEAQLRDTVSKLLERRALSAIRAGVWKPRTRPGGFEGSGRPALEWLAQVQKDFNTPIAIEVGNAQHVEWALEAGIRVLWLGARTTVNPFYVQEIADALQGVDAAVMVKNPLHPDIGLWVGAIERVAKSGVTELLAIHRGFFSHDPQLYRNDPKWELAIELRRHLREIPIICDPSHIAGKRNLVGHVAQTAMDLQFDGLMIESHIDPSCALSDAEQQITPEAFHALIDGLILRSADAPSGETLINVSALREKIDSIDLEIISYIARRMKISDELGHEKKAKNMAIFQAERWMEILQSRTDWGSDQQLREEFIEELFSLIHKYSIHRQTEIMHRP